MIVSDEKLARLQNIELEVLCEFIRVCEILNLKYYVIHGTLLGTVRHKGFIPWDDDIDVAMPREDYDKFVEHGQRMLPSYLFVQTQITDPEYFSFCGKIRNLNTTYIESTSSHLSIKHGVFIDIFPLDFYPDDKFEQKKLAFFRKWYTRRINCKYILQDNLSASRRVKSAFYKMLMPSDEKIIKKRNMLYKKTTSGKYYINYGGGANEVVPVEWFGSGTVLLFEGIKVSAPCEYEKWLTQVYGDYMQLPPEEKRVGHHYADVIDLDKPYTEYVK